MKKKLSTLLIIILLFSISLTAYAAETNDFSENDNVMPFQKVKELFPNVPIREDGYVEGYTNEIAPYSLSDDNFDAFAQPIESYSAEYSEGICTLNIYSNGVYGTVGYEKIGDVPATRGAGYDISGSRYRSYFTIGTIGFYYNYTLYNALGTNYSQLHNLSSPTAPMTGYDVYWEFIPGTTGYTRQTQTASAPAEIYGYGYHTYKPSGIGTPWKLVTTVSYGRINVNANVE